MAEILMIFIGIDCGTDGAIGWLNGNEVHVQSTPTFLTGKGTRRDYDLQGMVAIVKRFFSTHTWAANAFAVLEEQAPIPKKVQKKKQIEQGAASLMKQGRGQGIWEGLLASYQIPYKRVRPHVWKKLMLAGMPKAETPKAKKDQSIQRAKERFPQVSLRRTPRCTTDDDGMAEALLLADYGRLTEARDG